MSQASLWQTRKGQVGHAGWPILPPPRLQAKALWRLSIDFWPHLRVMSVKVWLWLEVLCEVECATLGVDCDLVRVCETCVLSGTL